MVHTLGALSLALFYLVLMFGVVNILLFCIIDDDD